MKLTLTRRVILVVAAVAIILLLLLLLLFPPRKDRPTLTFVLQIFGLLVIAALLIGIRLKQKPKQEPDKDE